MEPPGLTPNFPMRRYFGLSRIDAFVAVVAVLSVLGLGLVWQFRQNFPGSWAVLVFVGLGVLLELSSTTRRGSAAVGSISFLVNLSAIPLFGAFWAPLLSGAATLATQSIAKRPFNRVIFNTAQTTIAVLVAAAAYHLLGGAVPPDLVVPGNQTSFQSASHTIVAFLVCSVGYFLTNSVLVSGAISISSGRSFGVTWRSTSLNLLPYDVASSLLALVVAWLYLVLDDPSGLRRFVFLGVFAPIIVIKHAYTKLRTLQELYDELDTAHARLELNVREQLAMMVKSIEARDPYTSGHSMRVSALSKAIAVDFGLSDELVSEIENAALLHDVGKIHEEFAPLLSKDGKLTPEEWEIMKTHSVKSAELVGLFSRFRGHVQDSVRHHHERWDGLGYPDGVASESIPLGARIIMLADTIDAMTTDRPYRKALGLEMVIAELIKHRGTQFDPRLVDCVVNSVSVRRMIVSPGSSSGPSQEQHAEQSANPLRSHGSFFLGRRVNRGGSAAN